MQMTNDDTTLMAGSSDSELEDEAIIETSIGPQPVIIQEPDDVAPQETNDHEMTETIGGVESEEEHEVPMDGMPSMKQKKMRHKEKFASWIEKKKLEEPVEAQSRVVTDEDQMSAKDLISSKKRIIHDPRVYQMELFELAKQRNTIAVLDTGSGKTLIACLLLRYTVDQEIQGRLVGKQRRVSFFLVDNVTLVFQQAAVLECNLDAPIGKYCGAMGTDMWSKERWDDVLDRDQVIVMTADVLHNCLTHGLIKMKDINLICFDEAHHAKKNHVYARIMRDFYADEPEECRPKIFGMTASPVDSRDDPTDAAIELERLLHSQIATASENKLLQASVTRPKEEILPYPAHEPSSRTPLYNKLERFKKTGCIYRILKFSLEATSQLGWWCADEIWKVALSETEAQKIETRNERLLRKAEDRAAVDKVENEIRLIREAREIVSCHDYNKLELVIPQVSGKILSIQTFLEGVFNEETDDKCIIFVTQRYTAYCLAALLQRAGKPFMRLGVLIGTRSGKPGEENVTFKQQTVTVSKFRKGKLNCLIATSVAEEGLDIPDCTIIIRFDLYTTMIQYIQSRGRARHSSSKYVQMVESGNMEHPRRIMEVRKSERVMREFCQSLPEDRILKGLDLGEDDSGLDVFYIEPTTRAKLTPSAALQLLWRFSNSLPKESEYSTPPTYYIRETGDRTYICEIILPANSPVVSVTGKPQTTKAAARQSAAFEACLELRKKECLDEHLLPLYIAKIIPKGANALLSIDSAKVNAYHIRAKPTFWDIAGKTLPDQLYVTVFGLVTPKDMGRPYQPLSMITRDPIPKIPEFTVYADQGGESEVYAVTLDSPLPLTPTILGRLNRFTERFFYDVFAKKFEISSDIPYWIMPIRDIPVNKDMRPDEIFDNDLIDLVMEKTELHWDETTPPEFFSNRFLLHRLSRSRRFFSHHVAADLTPHSSVPIGACTSPRSATIYDYSYFQKEKGKEHPRPDYGRKQPVIHVMRVLHRINYLDPPTLREKETPLKAYVVPSAFEISCLPPPFVSFSIAFPAISTRLDSYLYARDVCNLMGINTSLGIALEAITKDSDHSENDDAIKIGPKKGMGSNYERLEFLGDTFLKLATTLSLFVSYDDDNEFHLHVKRMMMICNQNLFLNAKAIGLPEYIQTQGFTRHKWYPQLKLLAGRKSKQQKLKERLALERKAEEERLAQHKAEQCETEGGGIQEGGTDTVAMVGSVDKPKTPEDSTQKVLSPEENATGSWHKLAPKTIADVCEALIGAAVQDKGFDEGIKVINTVVNQPDHDKTKFTQWSSYREYYTIPTYQAAEPLARHLVLAQQIKEKIKYSFKYPRLLASAFIHSSIPFSWEGIPCYQRLEFLGDALHDQACIRYIYDKYPDKGPQWLTEHKMAMVSNKFLACLAVKLDFHRHLRKNGTGMQRAIQDFVGDVQNAELAAKEGARDFWVNITGAVPKALGDCLEAFIGAIFVDAGFDFSVVENFFNEFIKPYFEDMSIYDTYAGNHPTTLLTTRLKEVGCEDWRILSEEVTVKEATHYYAAVMVHNRVFAYGKAHSVKNARSQASQKALEYIEVIGLTKFLDICDCAAARERYRNLKQRRKEAEKEAKIAGLSVPELVIAGLVQRSAGIREEPIQTEIRAIDEELEGKHAVEIEI